MPHQIVTANRLIDGAVVYFTANHTWSIAIKEAWLIDDNQAATTVLAITQTSVDQNEVLDPYLIDVAFEDQAITPARYREHIRAKGPSTLPHEMLNGHKISAGAVAA